MKALRHSIDVKSASEVWTVYGLFDIHKGDAACNQTRLHADIKAIRDDPFALWLGGGDYITGIDHLDPRYDPRVTEIENIERQCEDFADMMAPIYDKCIGLLEGNHEFQIERHKGGSAYRYICKELESRRMSANASAEEKRKAGSRLALGVQGYVTLSFKRPGGSGATGFTIYCEHGAGGGDLAGGDALMLGRLLSRHDCHVALCGHRHRVHILKTDGDKVTRNGNVELYRRYAAICGAYLEPYLSPDEDGYPRDSYAERKHKAPIDSDSWVRLKIKPFAGKAMRLSYWLETG